ncbi:RNA-directed DNA polymerase, eukaryota, reverse transcriptase zinc-binding domain protein [Tanacetum coccineum]|uniref:RNA-directed DNA polymerase, eukaryota, reverse transcriptase zinc-binding domain protein n=1 Tax=Tanacetum coccineum TaxID=301880 RepID=A0ABQ5HE18_9ASTR
MENIDICNVKLWGNSSFDYICGPSVGNSGGILSVWDPCMFEKDNSTISDYFVAIRGKWIHSSKNYLIISIYAPQELSDKKVLWDYLHFIIDNWAGEVVIMGDFNEVRTQDERFGSIFNIQGAAIFNSFISSSEGLMESCPNISAISLDRYLSDHRPILLCELCFDYGPTPFRFYHYWFELEGFDKFVEQVWNDYQSDDSNAMLRFMNKLKFLKTKLCSWTNTKKESLTYQNTKLKSTLIDIDKTIDAGYANSDLLNNRKNVMTSLLDMEKIKSLEVDQKTKIKWLNVDLEKYVSLEELKRAVWDCGMDKSPGPDGFTFGFYRRYWSLLEKDVIEAVSYFFQHGSFPKGGNSSFIALIPKSQNANMVKDFRPISLIGSLYKIIAKIMANRLVGVLEDIVSDVQSAFVAGRQILDGPFILNDLIQWCKSKKKKQTMIFKVDFEKAFDSVRWDYLDEVLKKFGFGDRWCGWIHSCLRSSRGSILVNGSPTKEFQFHKGLKQGDPLSPFLFILIMESLHLSFQNVVNAGMFKGVSIGSNLHLSHLFYADDVVFLGQWSNSNISTIIKVLKCFFCASGLSINMHKSKLMGIAVDDDIVNQAAHSIGCLQLKSPFSYLGSRIGGSMSRINSWDDIVNKLLARLSKWKMKTLSIGGRLTLLKSVLGSTPIYYMSLFKVPSQVLKRIKSIRSRFFNGVDIMKKKLSFVSWNNVLASKDIGAMHGKDGNLSTTTKSSFPSIWLDIIRELHNLKNKGIDLLGLIKKKIGNGVDTLFWEDTWKGDIAFKFLYPRIYKLETCKQINVASKLVHDNVRLSLRRMPRGGVELEQFTDMINSLADLQLPNMQDRWFWSLSGSGDFSVASARKIIDSHLLSEVSSKFSWRKMVPIKVNILAWKVKLDVLPTRFNLSKRGLDINSILCPICENHAESSSHLFFACSMARDIFHNIASWWDVKSPHVSSFEEWEMWTSSLTLSSRRKQILEGIIYIGWWSIWNFRNQVVFGSTIPSKASLFDDIVARSFQWCKHKGKFKFSLIDWFKNPYLVNI